MAETIDAMKRAEREMMAVGIFIVSLLRRVVFAKEGVRVKDKVNVGKVSEWRGLVRKGTNFYFLMGNEKKKWCVSFQMGAGARAYL